jgi:hypothetical protein
MPQSKAILILLLVFTVAIIGCSSSAATLNEGVLVHAEPSLIPLLIEKEPHPSAVEEIVSIVSQTGGTRAVTVQERTYLIIALGQRNTAGYSVEITSIKNMGNQIEVKYLEKKPGPGDMVAQVITYPYVVASIPKTALPIQFEKQN